MVETEQPNYPLQSVDRALTLLSVFRTRPSLSLSEVANELAVTPSTAHRLLAMFVWRGYASQNPQTRQYHVGPALLELGLAVFDHMTVMEKSRRVVRELADELGETVHLAVLSGTQVSYIDGVESTKALRAGGRVGVTMPAHATAAGKVLLAQLLPHQVDAIYRGHDFESVTARTLSSRAALETELAEIRRRGYAVNDQESELGLIAVAAAYPGISSLAHTAVAVAVPSVRADADDIIRLGELLVARLSVEISDPASEEGTFNDHSS